MGLAKLACISVEAQLRAKLLQQACCISSHKCITGIARRSSGTHNYCKRPFLHGCPPTPHTGASGRNMESLITREGMFPCCFATLTAKSMGKAMSGGNGDIKVFLVHHGIHLNLAKEGILFVLPYLCSVTICGLF